MRGRSTPIIEELYGWNIFESIRYEIIEEKDKQGLLVHVRDKSWGPNFLQLGLALSIDFEGDSTWDIGVSLLKTALNRRAGELRLAAQIGESPLVLAELYQPLDVGLGYFITPQLFYDSRSVSRFEGGDEIEEFCVRRYGGCRAGHDSILPVSQPVVLIEWEAVPREATVVE